MHWQICTNFELIITIVTSYNSRRPLLFFSQEDWIKKLNNSTVHLVIQYWKPTLKITVLTFVTRKLFFITLIFLLQRGRRWPSLVLQHTVAVRGAHVESGQKRDGSCPVSWAFRLQGRDCQADGTHGNYYKSDKGQQKVVSGNGKWYVNMFILLLEEKVKFLIFCD